MAEANEKIPEQGVIVETMFQINSADHPKGLVVLAELLVSFENQHYMKLVASKYWLCKCRPCQACPSVSVKKSL